MKQIYKELLDGIPDYKAFLTLDEIDESSHKLNQLYPDCTEIFEIGKTREGRALYCLKIGSGSKNALMFGCPHPNEPIGVMMLEYFSEALAKSEELQKELDYTWYIVKAWDADGLEKNKKWLKGPFTITNYSKNFFRPAMYEQVDWTFPIDYKDLHFHDTLPETKAMMNLIDKIEPTIIYSLHNAGFGGVYWYVSHDKKPMYQKMEDVVNSQNIPIHFGEPESPYLEELYPAVYKAEGTWQSYDYLEKNGIKNIPDIIRGGTCSDDYAKQRYNSFTLLTEMPYFYDSRIEDANLSGLTRKEAVIDRINRTIIDNNYLKSIIVENSGFFSKNNPYILAIEDFSEEGSLQALRKDAEENSEYKKIATVAEVFDNSLISKFYTALSYGMLPRAFQYEVDLGKSIEGYENIYNEAKEKHRNFVEQLETEFNYQAIPIKKLVYIQLGCGLIMADHFN